MSFGVVAVGEVVRVEVRVEGCGGKRKGPAKPIDLHLNSCGGESSESIPRNVTEIHNGALRTVSLLCSCCCYVVTVMVFVAVILF